MATILNSVFVLVFVVLLNGLAYSNGLQCYSQRCLNCTSENLTRLGNETVCNPFTSVVVGWLDDLHISFPRETVNISDYTCIKMYAEPEPGVADSKPDLIRGCVNTHGADLLCDELITEERARGREAKCYKCSTDLCNSGAFQNPALVVLAFGALVKIVMTFWDRVV